MLALGVGVGLVNGLIITKLQVNAFIATLGTALIIKGLIDSNWDGPAGGVPRGFSQGLGYTRFGVIPASIFLLAGIAAVIWFILRYTPLRLPHLRGRRQRGRLEALRVCGRTARSSRRTSCAR